MSMVGRARRLLGGGRRRVRRMLPGSPPGPRRDTSGRWPAPALDRHGVDPAEVAAVRAGWLLVDAHERLGTAHAREVFGREFDAWFAYARGTLPDLVPWEAARGSLSIYQNDNNRLRFRRVLDFVRPGDRVFDIGVGRGYLCGVLLRDGGVAAYHGIDILPSCVEATQQMLAANDLSHAEVRIGPGDLFDLTRAQVAGSGATLVICCEVLEHIPDPERALRVLADALPDGADLLFSVPLYGRLEAVWGHCTTFDVARLKSMLEAADLTVHHVEPLANTWTVVVASRDLEQCRRVREAAARPPVNVSVPLHDHRDFVAVDRDAVVPGRWVSRTDCEVEPASHGRAVCRVSGHDPAAVAGGQYGGVAFPVRSLTALRLELGLREVGQVRRVYVDAQAGSRRVARWVWAPTAKQVAGQPYRRFAFRRADATPPFRGEDTQSLDGVDRVEVFVEVKPGERAELTVRAAYLP